MTRLVQILLPLYDNEGRDQPRELFREVGTELTERFGGLTAHTRAPAEGLWKEDQDETARDDIVIYEVMSEGRDDAWWADYRRRLERRFGQERIIIRATRIELL